MQQADKKYVKFDNKMLIVGFGSIGQAILPLILRHIAIKPEQITIITKKEDGREIAKQYGIPFLVHSITQENYLALLNDKLHQGDFLLNLSVDVSSKDLITLCQEKDALYLDTCIEPWQGGYIDPALSASMRSNYAMRDSVLSLRKGNEKKSTALLTHGANPGLVSHFVKQALLNIAKDNGLAVSTPNTAAGWAHLAQQLNIKVIHIAERDTQIADKAKRANEFVNTWSIDGFVSEGSQPAELGWGTHERNLPIDGQHHQFGSQCAIYLNRPGAATRVRTWTPESGAFHAFLITHSESISISDYLTIKEGDTLQYRPTVHFAYHPCEDAVLSVNEYVGNEWQQQSHQRLLANEIVDGMDELGVLLMGNKKGAYWFGSQLSIHEARKLAPNNNATTLQVAIGTLSGVIWVMEHPHAGIIEPDEIDFEYVMHIAEPYLGKIVGHYTDWTPLQKREKLFPENIDHTDPWQFTNVLVQ